MDAFGHVLPNAYAFPPLYPMLVRLLMMATGLDFTMAGPIVSLACGAGAMVLVYRLVADTAGRPAGALTVVLLCTFMSAPVFQISYSEGLALLLVSGALWLLTRRQYGALATVLFLLALTRMVTPALALVILVHGWARYRNRSDGEAFPLGERLRVVGLAGWGLLVVGVWPLCVAVMTGKPSAYLDTMAAWVQDGGPRALTAWPSVLWQQVGVFGIAAIGGCSLLLACAAAGSSSVEHRGQNLGVGIPTLHVCDRSRVEQHQVCGLGLPAYLALRREPDYPGREKSPNGVCDGPGCFRHRRPMGLDLPLPGDDRIP